jgi:hypothetical protein
MWLLDFKIVPVENYLRSPGLKMRCIVCEWESKLYREGESLYGIVQDLYRDHSEHK